jgi:EAL and modified HD-GYP domain-containing signal transduction protein
MKTPAVMIGRQPIFDHNLELVAYELLFRSSAAHDVAQFPDADEATSKVIANTFSRFGIERITSGLPAFINLTRGFLTGKFPLPSIGAGKCEVVLEVLEDIVVDTHLVDHLHVLAKQGYTIALDDFIYAPGYEAMIEIADIVKLDINNMSRPQITEHVELLRRPGMRLLAEKIETAEELAFCQSLEFDLYQGYILGTPTTITDDEIAVGAGIEYLSTDTVNP